MDKIMMQSKTLLENYKSSNYYRSTIFMICPLVFIGSFYIFFTVIFKDSKKEIWQFYLAFAFFWTITLLILVFAFIQLIMYKIAIKKEKNSDYFSNKFISICLIFWLSGLPNIDELVIKRKRSRLKIIFKSLFASLLSWIVVLMISLGQNAFEIVFVISSFKTFNQILYLVIIILFIEMTVINIIKFIYLFWLYYYNGVGSEMIKIFAIISGSYWAYKKIINFNKEEIKNFN